MRAGYPRGRRLDASAVTTALGSRRHGAADPVGLKRISGATHDRSGSRRPESGPLARCIVPALVFALVSQGCFIVAVSTHQEPVLIAGPRAPIIAPADLTRFLVAVGLVPLLLVIVGPPWSFALTPSWTIQQLVVIALAGVGLGVTSARPAQGLAGVTLGILVGLAVDLWWLAGWVGPFDQGFVTLLPRSEWRSRLIGAALSLLGVISAGYLVGAVVLRPLRDRSPRELRRPTVAEAVAVGLAVVGAPVLALVMASAAASSALVVLRWGPGSDGRCLRRFDRRWIPPSFDPDRHGSDVISRLTQRKSGPVLSHGQKAWPPGQPHLRSRTTRPAVSSQAA